MAYTYTKIFDPPRTFIAREGEPLPADEREGRVYVYDDDIVLAVNIALATGRPLLIRGGSGTGKSSLARNVANWLKWRFYEKVITSRTQARDLLYEVDLLRRLHDAQIRKGTFNSDYTRYIEPGVLWWAFHRGQAVSRGSDDRAVPPAKEPRTDYPESERAVILLDEIDKADPDVPNNLLVPLGSLEFQVEETGTTVKVEREKAPLVFLTTNDERELPPAFLRRCVDLEIRISGREKYLDIGNAHFRGREAWVRERLNALIPESPPKGFVLPSPAELVDVLRACDRLAIHPGTPEWNSLTAVTIRKSKAPGGM